MFLNSTPESCGISSYEILRFLKILDSYGFSTHSVIMARGNKIFTECYYKPFDCNFKHRMYSVSKSFVAVAIGFAAEEGILSLDDKLIDFFEEYKNENVNENLCDTSIRDMLKMETSIHCGIDWFSRKPKDRTAVYFEQPADKIPGTLFSYDSSGSYMLGVIIERLTGKTFLEYLQEKVLDEIGFSKDAYCLKAPGGYSFGDSGVMCTPKDLLVLARFIMNKGRWNGKQYLNEEYINDAISCLVSNGDGRIHGNNGYGYGYQIWKTPGDGFGFVGMGDQLVICHPETDFIFIINSDNQGNGMSRAIIYHELYHSIILKLTDPIEEDAQRHSELLRYIQMAELMHLKSDYDNPLIKDINNKKYFLQKNPMGIEYVIFGFEGRKGNFSYKNKQGVKNLTFGIGYNEFGYFPQDGYSDLIATEYAEGNMYRCACSADWPEVNKLRIKVQIIDKYFGNACFIFSFKDDRIAVEMIKTAEDFMSEYEGIAMGREEKIK